MLTILAFVHADPQCGDRLHSARIAKQSDGLAAYAFPILRRGLVRSLGRLLSGVPFARREVSSVTYSHSRTRCEPRSFEHRKRKGCAILLASCSGALCQSHLEKGLAKDQLLETEPDATRSGMAIETGEPIPTSLPPHPCECAVKPDGVRAIPADHDVYPIGDEPPGAMIQTEPPEPKLSKILQDPSSLHNVNRTGRHSGALAPRGCKPFLPLWMTAAIARLFHSAKPCGSSVVEPVGIEPTTPCLQSRCSPS